jgi:hypothetical protein
MSTSQRTDSFLLLHFRFSFSFRSVGRLVRRGFFWVPIQRTNAWLAAVPYETVGVATKFTEVNGRFSTLVAHICDATMHGAVSPGTIHKHSIPTLDDFGADSFTVMKNSCHLSTYPSRFMASVFAIDSSMTRRTPLAVLSPEATILGRLGTTTRAI